MKKKKALIITEVYFPEDFLINDLVSLWNKEGYELEVLTRNPSYPYGKVLTGYKNKLYQKECINGVVIHRFFVIPGYQKSTIIKIFNYFNYIFWSFWILLFIGKRYDRVFIYQTGPLTNALTITFYKKVFKFKIAIWSQDLWPETVYAYGIKKTKIIDFILKCIVKYIYKRCDIIYVSCKGFKERLEFYVPEKKIEWVPNWPLINGSSVEKEFLPGAFNFTFAGNIGKVQNLDNVILGFKNISINFPNAYLNIIGDGSHLETLKSLVSKENIQNINFTGRKSLKQMPAYFSKSDVLIISLVDVPLYEIMIPSKFQTYLTASKPIFAIMKGEVELMVKEYDLGMSVSPSDVVSIEKSFMKFLSLSDNQLALFSNNSKSLLEDHFDKEKIIKSISNSFWN